MSVEDYRVITEIRNLDCIKGISIAELKELLECKRAPDKKLQAKYHKTDHFKLVKQKAIELHGGCELCNSNTLEGLTFHHTTYTTLFRENIILDGVLVCRRCHRKLHGKG
jgi:DNA-binding transcriptional MerR regulator